MSGLIRGLVFYALGTAALYCGLWAYLIWRCRHWEWDRLMRRRAGVCIRNGEWADSPEGGDDA